MTGGRILGATVALLTGHGLLFVGLAGLGGMGPLTRLVGDGWTGLAAAVLAVALAGALALVAAPTLKRAALARVAGHPSPWRHAMRALRRGRTALVVLAGCLLTWGVVAPDNGLGALGRRSAGIAEYWQAVAAFLTAGAALAATRLLHPSHGGAPA
ncbi:MAG: hypothetical protein AAF371_07435 [Pseudomonadota bacterium]